ncbi:hypothetical protein OVA24_18900 [Luteolibacter sp. SL250]|uniref:hypothetical protein n=1 Tax=Luteolibacter sp. SL250 TaxID=2995170 RepID=UPI0022708826|nr:hypothetical protein [Luteolibacter sp. SL250]WAC19299.1 hypothetical protein OVA24_18900 [Luteolibacter sp. SL250]
MSAAAEFFLIALAIYLWESGLWLPLRAAVLRKRPFSGRWGVHRPGQWMSTRELGLVAMLPAVPDTGLAPCQAPPLLVTPEGKVLLETAASDLVECGSPTWEDIKVEAGRLTVGGVSARVSSPRMVDLFRRAKKRGLPPADGIADAWKKAMSPHRAAKEWRRWRLVSSPLAPLCLLLTTGFFIGMPVTFLYAGVLPMLGVVLFLWVLMLVIGCRLWWLSRRVYPAAKAALRGDVFLCCVVPFHAMRALEVAAVHAMATTHPAALLLSTGDTENPWLGRFSRELLHPRPDVPHDDDRAALLRPLLEKALLPHNRDLSLYGTIPSDSGDEAATRFCPRCHSVFADGVDSCTDCKGVPLKAFP